MPDATPSNALHASSTIRPVTLADVPGLKAVIDGTGLFPSALLDDMLAGYLSGQGNDDSWLTVAAGEPEDGAIAVAYVAPERMTSGTWNLYLIAVLPAYQSRGVGAGLVRHIEDLLAARGARVLAG